MEYKFYIHTNKTFNWNYIRVSFKDNKYRILENILFSDDWTPQKIQSIITGIEESKTKEKGEEYKWANEDVRLYANKNGVFLIDDLAARGGEKNPDNLYLRLTHEEILTFLNDFKKFVEENS